MKKIFILFSFILFPVLIFSQQSRFEYVEGEVSIKRASGTLFEAQIDDVLNVGDSVITGFDGFAELSLENSSQMTIDSDTVFVFSQKEKKGEKKNIFMVVLGKIRFKFDRLLHEPDIQTPATVAGIRGTEFTVVSALDGSAMYIVDEGSVAVESEGSMVVLTMEEGVEVALGEMPGDKFEVKVGSMDFSNWLDEGNQQFQKDPAGVLSGMTEKLIDFSEEANKFHDAYNNSAKEILSAREKMAEIENEKGEAAKSKYFQEIIKPLQNLATNSAMNYRYYSLSALSLRRYVISLMYIDIKTKYILDKNNDIYISFLVEYDAFLKIFETDIIKSLVEADI